MIDDVLMLDGNAAAGALARFFVFDATCMILSCEGCGAESPLGALHLYGGKMGIVLRCPRCDTINLRACEIGGKLMLDARGATRMTFRPEFTTS
jgi:hypothetical protein